MIPNVQDTRQVDQHVDMGFDFVRAVSAEEVEAVQRLRYAVYVEELGRRGAIGAFLLETIPLRFLYRATEPVLRPIRNRLPTFQMGLDLSPMIVLLAIYFLESFLIGSLRDLAVSLR